MRRSLTIAGLTMLVWSAGSMLAGSNVWITAGGDRQPARAHVMIEDEGESFDLSELADGETRIFGGGDSQVTVRREGDVATIERAATDEKPALELTCSLGRDTCRVITVDDDPQRVMVMIESRRECIDGQGDCDPGEMLADLGEGHSVVIRKVVECDDEGNCDEEVVHSGGDPAVIKIEALASGAGRSDVVFVGEGGNWVGKDARANVLFLAREDKAVLRCPKGDTTMWVEADEAEQVFLCPKHAEPLTKVEHPVGMHRIELIEEHGDPREY